MRRILRVLQQGVGRAVKGGSFAVGGAFSLEEKSIEAKWSKTVTKKCYGKVWYPASEIKIPR